MIYENQPGHEQRRPYRLVNLSGRVLFNLALRGVEPGSLLLDTRTQIVHFDAIQQPFPFDLSEALGSTGADALPRDYTPLQAHMSERSKVYELGGSCCPPLCKDSHTEVLNKMMTVEEGQPPTKGIANCVAHYTRVFAHHFNPTKPRSVIFEFHRTPPHPMEPHKHTFTAEQALLVMAGGHDRPKLFEAILNLSDDDDMVKTVSYDLHRGAFISYMCLDRVVREAVIKGLSAQNASMPGISPSTNATRALFRAHRVVSAYLVGLETHAEADAKRVMRAVVKLNEYLPPDTTVRDKSAYSGITSGLCLAGVMRFFKDELARSTKQQARLEYALNVLQAGLSAIPTAGAIIGPLMTLVVIPIAKRAFDTEDHSEQVVRLGATLEDAALRADCKDFDAREFNMQLQKTMRHCGFSY